MIWEFTYIAGNCFSCVPTQVYGINSNHLPETKSQKIVRHRIKGDEKIVIISSFNSVLIERIDFLVSVPQFIHWTFSLEVKSPPRYISPLLTLVNLDFSWPLILSKIQYLFWHLVFWISLIFPYSLWLFAYFNFELKSFGLLSLLKVYKLTGWMLFSEWRI